MIKRTYYPEIDGLRAIAVTAVLLFHFKFAAFSGGYTGVDIFFVISGFLITRNIVFSIQNKSFSFGQFYLRRIRRLFPALFATYAGTLLLGYLLFTPEHLARLGKSSIFSMLSVSNFFFWSEAGYFDTSLDFKPLLHTWSLSIEEQFYFVWPSILLLLSKTKKTVWTVLFIVSAGVASVYWAELRLVSDPSGAFFLPFSRIVEFAIGALLVWIIRFQPKNKTVLEPILVAGLILVLYAIFSFDENTVFPGINSLVPGIGAGLIIYACKSSYFGWLLRNRLSVGIGLISYSLYLIHWPLIVFYKYWKYTEFTSKDRLFLLIATIILAVLSYFFVEQPVRRYRFSVHKNGPKTFAAICATLAIALIISSSIIIKKEGVPQRISTKFSQVKNIKQFHTDQYGGKGYERTGKLGADKANDRNTTVILAGDSFALQYATGLDQLFKKENISATIITDYSCIIGPEITFLYKGKADKVCTRKNQQFFKFVKNNNYPVIFSQAWTWYITAVSDRDGKQIEFKDREQYNDFMINNLHKIRKELGSEQQLIIIGTPPGSGNRNGVISCLNRPNYLPNNCLDAMVFDKHQGNGWSINKKLQSFADATENTYFLDPYRVFCDENVCYALDSQDDKIWYSDGHHISIDGSMKFIDDLSHELLMILGKTSRNN